MFTVKWKWSRTHRHKLYLTVIPAHCLFSVCELFPFHLQSWCSCCLPGWAVLEVFGISSKPSAVQVCALNVCVRVSVHVSVRVCVCVPIRRMACVHGYTLRSPLIALFWGMCGREHQLHVNQHCIYGWKEIFVRGEGDVESCEGWETRLWEEARGTCTSGEPALSQLQSPALYFTQNHVWHAQTSRMV